MDYELHAAVANALPSAGQLNKCSALMGWKSKHLFDELIYRECHFVQAALLSPAKHSSLPNLECVIMTFKYCPELFL